MKFQIGKNGLNSGVLTSLELAFKTHKTIRVSVLRSLAPTKDKVKAIANELAEKLPGNYKHIVVGFTIILRKTKAL